MEGEPAPEVPEPPTPISAAPVVPAAAPTPEASPPAPTDGALRVAIEGQCSLSLDVLGPDAFVHDQETGKIVRLTGAKPRSLPAPRTEAFDKRGDPALPFNRLWGRWPDALFAEIVTEEGAYLGNDLLHWEGGQWRDVDGFAGDHPIRKVEPWRDGTALANVHVIGIPGPESDLRLVGGEAEAPDITPLRELCGDRYFFTKPTMDRRGNLGLKWSCEGEDHFAIWPAGESTPITHRLDMPFDYGPFSVDADERGGFFVSYRSGMIRHVDADGERRVDPPRGTKWLEHIGVGPDGRLFVVANDRVYRQTAYGWTRERVPGLGYIEQFDGTAHGDPWLRRGGSFYLHGYQYRSNGRIYARQPDTGKWRIVRPMRSTLDPDQRLYIDFIETDDRGHKWMLAHAGRPKKHEHPEHWAIVTTAPFGDTLGCP